MGKAHGGISYSLADTAFGFAANTHGKYAVSIETSINHIEALEEGDFIIAESVIEKVKNKLGFNIVEVKRGDELIALFNNPNTTLFILTLTTCAESKSKCIRVIVFFQILKNILICELQHL